MKTKKNFMKEGRLRMQEVKIKSYGKVNLVLDCLYKRPDGYHEVEMIMQIINLFDKIKIKPSKGINVRVNHPLVPNDQRNLAYQGALLVQEKYPEIPGVEIDIEKNIPVEAGLGGGSSNAASVILGMDKLFGLSMGQEEMLEMAAKLGSDVPFFLKGPTALAQGRGEKLTQLQDCPLLWLVMVKPKFGVKTAEVYENLNLRNREKQANVQGYIRALEEKDEEYLIKRLYNILETSTFQLYPEVGYLKASLKELGAKNVLMSGSGPTVFAIFFSQERAQDFSLKIKKEFPQVFVTCTIDEKLYKERITEHAL